MWRSSATVCCAGSGVEVGGGNAGTYSQFWDLYIAIPITMHNELIVRIRGFLMQCEMALLIYSRLHHQDVDVECWWCGVAEHFVGFRLIDSPWKIYQHPRLWNILLDKWKWMMQVPCCNIWISEKKYFLKLYLALWTLDFYQIWKTVLLLGRLYVGIRGDKRGWVGPHLCLTVY